MISEALRQSTPEPDASQRKPGQEFDTPKKHRVFALLDHRVRLGLSKMTASTWKAYQRELADSGRSNEQTKRLAGTARPERKALDVQNVLKRS